MLLTRQQAWSGGTRKGGVGGCAQLGFGQAPCCWTDSIPEGGEEQQRDRLEGRTDKRLRRAGETQAAAKAGW